VPAGGASAPTAAANRLLPGLGRRRLGNGRCCRSVRKTAPARSKHAPRRSPRCAPGRTAARRSIGRRRRLPGTRWPRDGRDVGESDFVGQEAADLQLGVGPLVQTPEELQDEPVTVEGSAVAGFRLERLGGKFFAGRSAQLPDRRATCGLAACHAARQRSPCADRRRVRPSLNSSSPKTSYRTSTCGKPPCRTRVSLPRPHPTATRRASEPAPHC
jgi:hypothetical protein